MAKEVDLSSISLPQLDHLRNTLEEEVSMLTASMAQLKIVQQKLMESKSCVRYMTPSSEGKEVLVPLTSSMYVPGLLRHNNTFICDVGTGYYVEKNQENALQFFQRKIDYLTSNLEKLQHSLQDKHKFRESVLATMQYKVQFAGRPTTSVTK